LLRTRARRFAVVPLTEDCGLIEWVPDTVTLRSAATGTYEEQGRYDGRLTNAAIKKAYETFTVRPQLLCMHTWRGQPRTALCRGQRGWLTSGLPPPGKCRAARSL
jgi:hypothetical protein